MKNDELELPSGKVWSVNIVEILTGDRTVYIHQPKVHSHLRVFLCYTHNQKVEMDVGVIWTPPIAPLTRARDSLPLFQRSCDHQATSYEEDRRTRGISNEWVDLLKCPPPQLFSRDSLRR